MVGAPLLSVSVGVVVSGGGMQLWSRSGSVGCTVEDQDLGEGHVLPVCLVPETLRISLQVPRSRPGWDTVQVQS